MSGDPTDLLPMAVALAMVLSLAWATRPGTRLRKALVRAVEGT